MEIAASRKSLLATSGTFSADCTCLVERIAIGQAARRFAAASGAPIKAMPMSVPIFIP
jgi:hypothetical protein